MTEILVTLAGVIAAALNGGLPLAKVHADEVSLSWEAVELTVNGDPVDLLGYRIHLGPESDNYPTVIDVPGATEYTFSGLSEGLWFGRVQAISDGPGPDGVPSDEFVFYVGTAPKEPTGLAIE